MAEVTELTPSEYISHHLTFDTVGIFGHDATSFWAINVDTLVMTVIAAVISFGFLMWMAKKATSGVPSKTQAFVEHWLAVIDDSVRGIYHGDSKLVAPIALTAFVLVFMLNCFDFLPVDIMSWIYANVFHAHYWRSVPTADINTTFALALSVFGMMIYYSIKVKGLGGWGHELISAPFGLRAHWSAPLLIIANVLFQIIEYVSKPLSHSLRLFGNLYAGEIIFMLLGMLAAAAAGWAVVAGILHVLWALFHILIVLLQAYIFMMLSIVYISMAHEHH
ncbi:MAG: F0F1 ATP synthase subunit A [Proteobacteria bacterium]|nr:F0F1 ATP synthase subunit A [Pseudomonadota bacterium]